MARMGRRKRANSCITQRGLFALFFERYAAAIIAGGRRSNWFGGDSEHSAGAAPPVFAQHVSLRLDAIGRARRQRHAFCNTRRIPVWHSRDVGSDELYGRVKPVFFECADTKRCAPRVGLSPVAAVGCRWARGTAPHCPALPADSSHPPASGPAQCSVFSRSWAICLRSVAQRPVMTAAILPRRFCQSGNSVSDTRSADCRAPSL